MIIKYYRDNENDAAYRFLLYKLRSHNIKN